MKHLLTPSTLLLITASLFLFGCEEERIIWQIGKHDNSPSEFALAPDDYKSFLEHDFGWEDGYYLIGFSKAATDWPYVLPGPEDSWGGTGPTAGIRSHVLNILFGIKDLPGKGECRFVADILDKSKKSPPLLKITVNDRSWKFRLRDGCSESPDTICSSGKETIKIPIKMSLLRKGGNEIIITTLEGGWLKFDDLRLEGPSGLSLTTPKKIFVRDVKPAGYETGSRQRRFQPLLVDIEHLSGTPVLSVFLENKLIFREKTEKGRYVFEAPMPAVPSNIKSKYRIMVDQQVVREGTVMRQPHDLITPAGYVNTKMGTAHSRWMIAPGPWMPFSMVKISPDNQNAGWQAGYDPTFENIAVFSHIHEWTMAGLGMLPVTGPLVTKPGDQSDPDSGYRSRIDKTTETAPLGYYSVMLTDYNIKAELTSTTRCSFQRYTFPEHAEDPKVLIDFQIPSEYGYQLQELQIEKVNEHRLEGYSKQHSPNVWAGGIDQDYTVHFVMEFDNPIKSIGFWADDKIVEKDRITLKDVKDAGAFVRFDTKDNRVVQVRTGISLVSIANAALNLKQEISGPFGWDFIAVRNNHVKAWDELLQRVKVSSNDKREKMRFYTNMYRALCSRNTWSDVDGRWVDAFETVRKFDDPDDKALGCDAFWNTFWNLNQFWNLITPEWSSHWVKSQLAMYKTGNWLAKGPAGMEYIPVMVAEHEIPLIVGAYQMGIRDFDAEKAFKAVKKMQTTPASKVGGGFAGNYDLQAYLKYHYVPYDLGRFSNSLEYSYDDWTVAQLAKALGKNDDYVTFSKRGNYWRNAIDKETGYARMRKSDGTWLADFDPYKSGANHHYVEGNAWQLTFFVPQDIPALAEIIGKDKFIERLNWGFSESYKWRYNGPNDMYWDYPVVQGNQQSMHFAFLFNRVGKPWLTQKWSRAVINRYYGYGIADAYLGDEDQGQMSAWFVMAALGLFQIDGGCSVDPVYEVCSPIFKEVVIDLKKLYGRGDKFIIKAKNVSRKNIYIQKATLNGRALNSCEFKASELLKGGNLILEMGPEPNKSWGLR